MSEEKYYVIYNSDGDTYVNEYSKEKLLSILNDEPEEYKYIIKEINESNTNYWKDGNLIIKGKIVVPIDKKVVMERDIE